MTKRKMSKRYGRVPRTTKVLKQTGTRKSVKADKRVKALPPGRRVSKTGKRYTETRRNRSDRVGGLL